jgi:two-component system, OmpR family, phosphate regulon response regulator PhoB
MNQARREVVRPNAASAPRILVVEDESDLALLLAYNLEAEGYLVESVERGDEAELRLAESAPDLVILDWMLPGVSGLEICRRLRARENTRTLPVIMVTARGEEAERVRGLSVGADDYVVKPFSVPELMARVRALLRRSRPERIADRLYAGDIDLDRETRRVRRGAREVHLGPTEFRLLEYLLEKPGRVFSRAQLLDGVWGQAAEIDERTVDVHVGRLRKALSRGRERDPIPPFAAPATPSTRRSGSRSRGADSPRQRSVSLRIVVLNFDPIGSLDRCRPPATTFRPPLQTQSTASFPTLNTQASRI